MSGKLTQIEGLLVGHYTDEQALTGCTAVVCPLGAVAGVDVRGSAPGTRETDLLRGYNAVERINAIMLCGGSAFGLDAASGAMRFLEEKNMGVDVGVGVVPIVPAAVIFDLGVGDAHVRPGQVEGYCACAHASREYETGRVGAGTGATVGKAYGMAHAMHAGLGSSCVELEGGVKVAALVVVNAFGDVYDPNSGRIVAGANQDGRFLNCMESPGLMSAALGNTTIGVVATNATLTREETNKLASMAHDGLAMTVRPVHTSLDGDTFFALSTCEKGSYSMLALQVAVVKAVCGAILDAVGQGERMP